MAEESRFQPVQTASGHGVMDRHDPGHPVVRAGLAGCVAEQIASVLNDLHEDNVFLRAMCRNQGLEIRPDRRAG